MGPTTRNGAKRPLEEGNNASVAFIADRRSKYFSGRLVCAVDADRRPAMIMLPNECLYPTDCERVFLPWPETGLEAFFLLNQSNEFVGRLTAYRDVTFRSLLTPDRVMANCDPLYVLLPVNPISLILQYLVKYEGSFQTLTTMLTDEQYPKMKTLATWDCVLNNLEFIGEVERPSNGEIRFKLERSKLEAWIVQRTLDTYEKVKSSSDTRSEDQSARDFAVKITRQQLPPRLHYAAAFNLDNVKDSAAFAKLF